VPETFTIVPRGPFSLAEAIGFGFGQRDAAGGDVMRLAFCLDGYQHQAGVEVRQDEAGVHGTVHGPAGSTRATSSRSAPAKPWQGCARSPASGRSTAP